MAILMKSIKHLENYFQFLKFQNHGNENLTNSFDEISIILIPKPDKETANDSDNDNYNNEDKMKTTAPHPR